MNPDTVLLSTACCAPVFYFSRIYQANSVFIEQHENFIRQTYRNRYTILGPNGPVDLVIPVEHGRKPGLKIRDVRIAYHTSWQRIHWRSIGAAYNNSPWFRDYEDEFGFFYEKKYTFLFDFNLAYTKVILDLLGIRKEILFTDGFENVPEHSLNLREVITPKTHYSRWSPGYIPPSYTQVFSGKFPFVPGLSILDLLFNEGPLTVKKF